MKDPAFLFYPNDWTGGTLTFSLAQKGAYMDLLVVQFNQGSFSLEDVKQVLGTNFWMWDTKLKSKFTEKDGLYFNPRLQKEAEKRNNYTSSRRKNRMSGHMEDRNENENIIKIIKNTYGEFQNVELFDDEYQKLVLALGEQNTKILIAELDTYIATPPK